MTTNHSPLFYPITLETRQPAKYEQQGFLLFSFFFSFLSFLFTFPLLILFFFIIFYDVLQRTLENISNPTEDDENVDGKPLLKRQKYASGFRKIIGSSSRGLKVSGWSSGGFRKISLPKPRPSVSVAFSFSFSLCLSLSFLIFSLQRRLEAKPEPKPQPKPRVFRELSRKNLEKKGVSYTDLLDFVHGRADMSDATASLIEKWRSYHEKHAHSVPYLLNCDNDALYKTYVDSRPSFHDVSTSKRYCAFLCRQFVSERRITDEEKEEFVACLISFRRRLACKASFFSFLFFFFSFLFITWHVCVCVCAQGSFPSVHGPTNLVQLRRAVRKLCIDFWTTLSSSRLQALKYLGIMNSAEEVADTPSRIDHLFGLFNLLEVFFLFFFLFLFFFILCLCVGGEQDLLVGPERVSLSSVWGLIDDTFYSCKLAHVDFFEAVVATRQAQGTSLTLGDISRYRAMYVSDPVAYRIIYNPTFKYPSEDLGRNRADTHLRILSQLRHSAMSDMEKEEIAHSVVCECGHRLECCTRGETSDFEPLAVHQAICYLASSEADASAAAAAAAIGPSTTTATLVAIMLSVVLDHTHLLFSRKPAVAKDDIIVVLD
jgi:hypothetical protein